MLWLGFASVAVFNSVKKVARGQRCFITTMHCTSDPSPSPNPPSSPTPQPKAVCKSKLGYDPVEVDPEDMLRLAAESPQVVAWVWVRVWVWV